MAPSPTGPISNKCHLLLLYDDSAPPKPVGDILENTETN